MIGSHASGNRTTAARFAGGLLVGVVFLLGVLIQASAEPEPETSGYTITTATKPGLGTYLTDSSGHALYYSTADLPGHSNCSGGCEVMWPPFYVSSIRVPAGLDSKDFGYIVRDNGRRQVTFRGRPLYLYSRDWSPGDTNGQALYGSWYLVQPALLGPTGSLSLTNRIIRA